MSKPSGGSIAGRFIPKSDALREAQTVESMAELMRRVGDIASIHPEKWTPEEERAFVQGLRAQREAWEAVDRATGGRRPRAEKITEGRTTQASATDLFGA